MKILLVAAVLLAGLLSVSAQEQVISEADFVIAEQGSDAAFKNQKGGPARYTLTTDARVEGRPQNDYTSRTVMEFGPNNSFRRTSESTFGGKPSRSDADVIVGSRSFYRLSGGKWQERTTKSDAKASEPNPIPTEAGLSTRTEYRYLGTGSYQDKKVRLYLKKELKEQVDKSGSVSKTQIAIRYCFGVDGDFYRSEWSSKTISGTQVSYMHITVEKQLDPSISITMPISEQ